MREGDFDQFGEMLGLVGVGSANRAHLVQDERFLTPRDRRRNAEALVAEIDGAAATRSRDAWAELFRSNDVWWAPVNSIDDVIVDPQAVAAGAFVRVPTVAGADLPEAASD